MQRNVFQGINVNSSIVQVSNKQNCSIVDTELFKRCESEEQLLDASGDIGMTS